MNHQRTVITLTGFRTESQDESREGGQQQKKAGQGQGVMEGHLHTLAIAAELQRHSAGQIFNTAGEGSMAR